MAGFRINHLLDLTPVRLKQYRLGKLGLFGVCRMNSPRCWLLTAVVALSFTSWGQAELIFLKDGYILQGKVRREAVVEFDPVSKEMISIPRGFFMVDDGPRRVYFSPRQVSIVERLPTPPDENIPVGRVITMIRPQEMPPIEEVLDTTPWNPKTWQREFYFRGPPPRDRIGVMQMIARVNPYYVQVDAATRFKWHAGYLTREFDPQELYGLLKANKAFVETPEMKPEQIIAKRMRLINFLTQTGWYDLAEKELDGLLTDLPTEKKRVNDARAVIDRQRAKDRWETIKTLYQGGRFQASRKAMDAFPLRNVPDKVLADLRELKTRLNDQDAALKEGQAALQEWAKAVATEPGRELARMAGVIGKELHPANIGRLDAFLGQAREATRQIARGKKPPYSPEELLSLAVSGFLLGSPSASPKPEVAINLWKTRVFILEYLREPNIGTREKLLKDYERNVTPRVDLDEIAQMVDFLPPVESVDLPVGTPVEMQCGPRKRIEYELVLPPEYTPSRQYPVIIALPHAGERAGEMVKRLAPAAAEHGYILASLEWGRNATNWGFSEHNHEMVLECLLDLRRKLQIDNDRVFLTGLGEGGKGVYDVGLSHPDLFAGILPVGGAPFFHARRYWRNAQFLPIYAVGGSRVISKSTEATREQFTQWVNRGFPALWIEYKGRGSEWLSGEVPLMFDWMRNQSREFPQRRLGTDGAGGIFGEEFTSVRATDNRFYWVSGTTIKRCQMPDTEWKPNMPSATITASVSTEGNGISVKSSGYSQISVWIGRNAAGRYLLDLERPVTIRHGLGTVIVNERKLTPSLGILLEDLYQRGDRRHLFVARVDFRVN
jgi:tetratricopeptide (TPR) repeat protein